MSQAQGEPFPPRAFQREDEALDVLFYTAPRLVVHIDEHAIAALRDVYARWIPRGARLLDLMSSWRSHLPQEVATTAREVVGHGMNAEELRNNPQLSSWFLQDLNDNPALPFPDGSFDAVVCAVSVQYLTAPLPVFREVARVLAPGGRYIVSFSNRMFPTKAVRIWRQLDDEGHVALVGRYFRLAGGFEAPIVERHVQTGSSARRGWFRAHDPLYAVIAMKS